MSLNLEKYRYLFLFCILVLVCTFIYFPAFYVGFLSDDYYALQIFQTRGFCLFYGAEGNIFMPLMLMITGILYELFGLNPLGYHVFILAMHIINALLLAVLTERLLQYFSLLTGKTFLMSGITALFFAAMPFHTEAVTWISSIGYVISLSLCIGSILVFLQWLTNRRLWWLLLCGALFTLAVLAKEVALALPGPLVIILFASYRLKQKMPTKAFVLMTSLVTCFFALIIIIYFLLRHYFIGEYIGHYGAANHLGFTARSILSGLIMYTSKFFLAYRYLPDLIHDILKYFSHHLYLSGTFIILLFIILSYSRKLMEGYFQRNEVRLSFCFFLCFVLSLIPVLNLDLSFVGEIQSDRYGYFPSLFYTLTALFIILSLTGKNTYFSVILFLLLTIWFSIQTYTDNKKWVKSTEISENFYRSMKKRGVKEKVLYLVNVPDTYRGTYVARCGIQEALEVRGISQDCEVHVLSYTAIRNENGVVNCSRDGDCIMIRNYDHTVKLMPDPHVNFIPGFLYSAISEGVMRICLTGDLSPDAAIIFIKPDGTLF